MVCTYMARDENRSDSSSGWSSVTTKRNWGQITQSGDILPYAITFLTLESIKKGSSALTKPSDNDLQLAAVLQQLLFIDGFENARRKLERSFVLSPLGFSEPQITRGLGKHNSLGQGQEI